MDPQAQLELAAEKAAQLVEKARSDEGLTPEESVELKQLRTDGEALARRLMEAQEAEELVKSLGAVKFDSGAKGAAEDTAPHHAASLGEHFVSGMKDAGVLSRLKGGNRIGSVDLPEFGTKAAGDVHVTGTATGTADHMLLPDIDRNIVRNYIQRPTIASWLGAGTIASNAIVYFVEKLWDTETNGNFATVAENAKKPGMTAPDYEEVTETLKKIAGWIKVSMEMAEDLPFLVSEINNRLLVQLTLFEEDQLLNGLGTGTTVKGLLNREGLQIQTAATKADNMDAIYKAINSVFLKTGIRADGIVINPADYEDLRLLKDANGQYLAGGPFSGQYGNGTVLQDPPLWGLQTIQTTAVARGTVVIGAGAQGATVYRKGGIRVEASNADGEDFTHNRFTILAEERLTLAVRRPDAFVKLTLGTA